MAVRARRTAARIDRAAAKWFARRTEPFAPIEAAYHQLQAMRGGGEPPSIDPQVLGQLDKETIAELPEEAQDLVRIAAGRANVEIPARRRRSAATPVENAAAANELEGLLERGDIAEASFVYARALAHQKLEPGSPEADIARTFLWRAGRWREATKEFGRHPFLEGGADTLLPRPVAVVHARAAGDLGGAAIPPARQRTRAQPQLAESAVDVRARESRVRSPTGHSDSRSFALGRCPAPRGASKIRSAQQQSSGVATRECGKSRDGQQVVDALAMTSSRFASLVSGPASAGKGDRRHRSPRLPDPLSPAGAAGLLATSTPYGSMAEALRLLGADRRAVPHSRSVDFDLADKGGLPPSGAGDWSVGPAVSPEGSIDNVAALGLLAEWLGAAAFVLRHPDLRLIARSAERWRRTTAGDWAYPIAAERRRISLATASRRDDRRSNHASSSQTDDPVAAMGPARASGGPPSTIAAPELAGRIARRFPAAIREARARPEAATYPRPPRSRCRRAPGTERAVCVRAASGGAQRCTRGQESDHDDR